MALCIVHVLHSTLHSMLKMLSIKFYCTFSLIFQFLIICIIFGNAVKGENYQGQSVRCGTYPLEKGVEYNTLSHDYPQHYPPGQACVWQFLGTPTCYPFLKCSNFSIVDSYLCEDDYLALSDGFDADEIGKKFCGKTSPNNFVSQTSILRLTFKSDIHSHGELGFNCTVSCFRYEPVYGYGNRYYYQPRPRPNLLPTSPQKVTDCDCGFKGPLVEKLHHLFFNSHYTDGDGKTSNEETDTMTNTIDDDGLNSHRTRRSSAINDYSYSLSSTTGNESPIFTTLGKYRWMGYLTSFRERKPLCGCTLINNLYVLTAAHCITQTNGKSTDPRGILVVLNDHNFANFTEMATITRYVAKVIRHPLYNPSTYDYDVAVLKLTTRIELNRLSEPILRTICLPPRTMSNSFNYQDATVIGWGRLSEGGEQLTTLQESEVMVISNEECNAQFSGRITSNMVCVGLAEGDKISCVAEAGSPLMKREYGRMIQIGIATYGRGCTKKYSPGVNSRVTVLNDWIRMAAKDGSWCQELNAHYSLSQAVK